MDFNVARAAQVLRRSAHRIEYGHLYRQHNPVSPRPAGVIETLAVLASGDCYWRDLSGCKELYTVDAEFAEVVDMLCAYLGVSGRLTVQHREGLNQVLYWCTDPAVTTREVVEVIRAAAKFHSSLAGA